MPRFVVLVHETPATYDRGTHLDLMLEFSGVLRTWVLDRLPADGETVTAERLSNHRLAYLDYEGEIAGQRGRVGRVDAGEYDLIDDSPAKLQVRIRGSKLQGTLWLTQESPEAHRWCVSLSTA
jgi:DNA polymerase ligase (LigD)-like protein